MIKSRYLPYGFNEKYEYKTYKNIGVQHRIEYFATKNKWYEWRLKIRNFRNRKEMRYQSFNTYMEWREYVKRNNEGNINAVNKIRFLNARRRSNEVLAQSVQGIATPIYVCIITMQVSVYVGNEVGGMLTLIVSSILCVVVLVVTLKLYKMYCRKRLFYEDYIEAMGCLIVKDACDVHKNSMER